MTEIEKAKANMNYLREGARRFPNKYYHAYVDARKYYERLLRREMRCQKNN